MGEERKGEEGWEMAIENFGDRGRKKGWVRERDGMREEDVSKEKLRWERRRGGSDTIPQEEL